METSWGKVKGTAMAKEKIDPEAYRKAARFRNSAGTVAREKSYAHDSVAAGRSAKATILSAVGTKSSAKAARDEADKHATAAVHARNRSRALDYAAQSRKVKDAKRAPPDASALVHAPVNVNRNGKTYQRMQWIKPRDTR